MIDHIYITIEAVFQRGRIINLLCIKEWPVDGKWYQLHGFKSL